MRSCSPRLGLLRHYDPKPLVLSKRYYRKYTHRSYPIISIVTPAFNHGDFIERTIKSVIEQNYPKLEYVVQDGGSTDGTVDILKRFGTSLTRWVSARDTGQANALNLGFKHTSGQIMAYLNSDDLLLPGTLDYVANFFAGHPDVDVVYGHRILIDEHDLEIGRWVLPPHDDAILSWTDYVPQETMFWRRSIWEKTGGYMDETFQFAMDWELILRFKDAGAKFARVPRFLGAFRVHTLQKTLVNLSGVGKREIRDLRRRCHGRNVTDEEVNRKSMKYLIRHLFCHLFYKLGLLRF